MDRDILLYVVLAVVVYLVMTQQNGMPAPNLTTPIDQTTGLPITPEHYPTLTLTDLRQQISGGGFI